MAYLYFQRFVIIQYVQLHCASRSANKGREEGREGGCRRKEDSSVKENGGVVETSHCFQADTCFVWL